MLRTVAKFRMKKIYKTTFIFSSCSFAVKNSNHRIVFISSNYKKSHWTNWRPKYLDGQRLSYSACYLRIGDEVKRVADTPKVWKQRDLVGNRKLYGFSRVYKKDTTCRSAACKKFPAVSNTVVILLKATKGKSQNRISLKQLWFLKNDKSESFLDFYLVYKYVCLKIMRWKL